jgi:hypothetical protein
MPADFKNDSDFYVSDDPTADECEAWNYLLVEAAPCVGFVTSDNGMSLEPRRLRELIEWLQERLAHSEQWHRDRGQDPYTANCKEHQ